MEITESTFGHLSIGGDVNTKRNRIPLEGELLTLRNLMAQSTRMSVYLENELKLAKAALAGIKEREQRLLTELESTRSELQVSMRFIGILENQYEALQADFGRLKGMAHPIRRYPPDILITIFKWLTVMEAADWCGSAINISHVCRQWRNIVLDSPSLWGCIYIPKTDSIPRIESFFKEMTCRLRSFAPEIRFRIGDDENNDGDDEDEDEEPSTTEAVASLSLMLKASNLGQLGRIDVLSFRLPQASVPHLVNLDVDFQTPIKRIRILATGSSANAASLNLTEFLQQFPDFNKVEIYRVPEITFSGTDTFDSVTGLKFDEVATVHSFFSDPKRFSNLTEVDFGESVFHGGEISSDIIFEELQSLSVECYDGVPWSHFHTPRLRRFLVYDTGTVTNDALSFLQRCENLRHLSVPISREKLSSLALAVKNVETLELSIHYQGLYDWKAMDMTSPPFPHLRSFTFVAQENLSLSEFEKLVAARCHPLVQAENLLPFLPLENLAIRYETEDTPFVEADLKNYPFLGRCVLTYRQPPSYWSDDWHECSFM